MSKRDEILAKLRENKDFFKSYGIDQVILFGSAARDEEEINDIDLCVSFNRKPPGGFEYFVTLEEIREKTEILMNYPVDLVVQPIRKDRLRHEIENEGVDAF